MTFHKVDDELLSAFLDGELPPIEHSAVARLVSSDESWRSRYRDFAKDSEDLKKVLSAELTDFQRDLVLELVLTNMPSGSERRRVPRFRRRWMLLVAFLLPAFLTLVFFQNPNGTCRLYLKKDGLELQAGRSIAEEEFGPSKTWRSPKLWGEYDPRDKASLNFQVDAEEGPGRFVEARVGYDFNGDGTITRTERYKKAKLDARRGWERFTPELVEEEGKFESFDGGQIEVTLTVLGAPSLKISGTPGEIILPYRSLRTGKGAYDE